MDDQQHIRQALAPAVQRRGRPGEPRAVGLPHVPRRMLDAVLEGAAVAPDVEAQVHFLERAMQRHRHAEQPRVGEQEPHEADERVTLPRVECGARRHARREQRRGAGVVEEHEALPARGEKRHATHRSRVAGLSCRRRKAIWGAVAQF